MSEQRKTVIAGGEDINRYLLAKTYAAAYGQKLFSKSVGHLIERSFLRPPIVETDWVCNYGKMSANRIGKLLNQADTVILLPVLPTQYFDEQGRPAAFRDLLLRRDAFVDTLYQAHERGLPCFMLEGGNYEGWVAELQLPTPHSSSS